MMAPETSVQVTKVIVKVDVPSVILENLRMTLDLVNAKIVRHPSTKIKKEKFCASVALLASTKEQHQ